VPIIAGCIGGVMLLAKDATAAVDVHRADRCVLHVITSMWAACACALTHWAAMERAARIGRMEFSGALLLKTLKLAVFRLR
jgi:hypothetical protein